MHKLKILNYKTKMFEITKEILKKVNQIHY